MAILNWAAQILGVLCLLAVPYLVLTSRINGEDK